MNVINGPLVNKIAKEILQNEKFREDCKQNIKEILKDGKLDANDTPYLISLVVDIFNNTPEFEITEDKIAAVFKIVLMDLINSMNLAEDNKEMIEKLIDSSLKLLTKQVKQKKLGKKICDFLSKLFTCKLCKK